jgi:3-hydroxybutyrate dehydrogenase
MQHIAPIEEFDDAKFNDIIAINLNSAFYAIKNSIPEMKRLDWGRIINIASVHGSLIDNIYIKKV